MADDLVQFRQEAPLAIVTFNRPAHLNAIGWRLAEQLSVMRATMNDGSRHEFWEPKLTANATRDERNARTLEGMGWRVETLWECDLGSEALAGLVERIRDAPFSRANNDVRLKDRGNHP